MNRRELIAKSAGAVAIAVCSGRAIAGNAFTVEPLCDNQTCANFLETTAREIMTETGEWKQAILRGRSVKWILVTLKGCCGCEITLPKGANHPDWRYVRRNLTTTEREAFHAEYGQQAPLLLGTNITPIMKIRGFILNGRQEEWNLSVRFIDA